MGAAEPLLSGSRASASELNLVVGAVLLTVVAVVLMFSGDRRRGDRARLRGRRQ